jgi:DNA repair exonuclease SbcCD nuclease subunit
MIRILHTADVHLGHEFPALREKGPDHRRQLLATFDQIINLATRQNVSLLLIAGDLFDTNAVLGKPVRAVLATFKKLEAAGIRACILPGTHDAYSEDSIYRFVDLPANVTVLTPQRVYQTYADLDLTVYGKAFDGKLVGSSALQGLSCRANSRLHVGMAYCSLRMEGATDREAMLVDKDEIGSSGFDYLALGHWHSFRDCSQGATKAFYCGSPEPISVDQKGAGSVALVTIHDRGRVDVQQIRVGGRVFDEMTINVELVKSFEEIAQIISTKADPDLILQVTLKGTPDLEHELDAHELEEELRGQFFCLRVLDRVSERLDDVPMEDYPQDTVAGGFIRGMEARMAKCSPDEKGIYAEALRLGVALIQRGPQVIE